MVLKRSCGLLKGPTTTLNRNDKLGLANPSTMPADAIEISHEANEIVLPH
jgi:hypothetical protein